MASTFSPSPTEIALVNQILTQYDPKKLGVITGDVALNAFAGANLTPLVLGEIWSIADEDNKGWLSKKGVAVAVRLMGWAQKGEKVTPALIIKPGPLPVIEGITIVPKQSTGISLPKSPPPPGLPPLTAADKLKFQRLFNSNGPINGLLSGEKARDVFVKSRLAVDKLSRIWTLADTQDRGALDCTDFVIGLYLIQASMSGQLPFIPSTLPPGLYEQAGGNPQSQSSVLLTHTTGTSGSFSPSVNTAFPQNRTVVHPQYTGQSQASFTAPRFPLRSASTAFASSAFSSPARNSQAQSWDVTAAEKVNFDRFFDNLDSLGRGYIEGDAAVPFMLDSKLSGDELAHIWDLSDLNKDGRLTRDGFAVAMHLIHGKLAGKEIPVSLPPSLIPPYMRPDTTATPLQHEPQDLFTWDETPPQSAAAPPTRSGLQSTPTGTQSSVTTSSAFTLPSSSSDPFGSAILVSHKDLLDDEDHVPVSQPLHDQSAEIGNLQNQVNSTIRSLESTKVERVSVEQTLANQATQLSSLQTQLSSAKAAYETETRLLATLRDRWTTQTNDIQKTREELIRAESDLSAVRVEKAEVEGSFLRDKEVARDLHRKMIEAGQQSDAIKLEVEKVKKEAKQQKGLLAIARKQLSTKEAERAKAEKDLEAANAELASAIQEREVVEAELEQDVPPNPVGESVSWNGEDPVWATPPQLRRTASRSSTPSESLGKSNNPFDRLMASAGSTPASPSTVLPFVNASSQPTPAGNADVLHSAATAENNPFGFSQEPRSEIPVAPAQDAPQSVAVAVVIAENGSSTPKPLPPDISIPPVEQASPNSAFTDASDNEYITPPTTSKGLSRAASPAVQNNAQISMPVLPEFDGPASKFPALDADFANRFPEPAGEENNVKQTDLGGKVAELDVIESDSDSDEDSVPLATLAKEKGGKLQAAAPSTPAPTNGTANPVDVLGFDPLYPSQPSLALPSPPAELPAVGIAKDAFGVPVADIGSSSLPHPPRPNKDPSPAAAGVNAFDDAMAKLLNNGSVKPASQFTFDSVFDDNFDFASAAEKFPEASNAVNGSEVSSVPAAAPQNDGFNSIFPPPNVDATPSAHLAADASVPFSFDSAFATNDKLPVTQPVAKPSSTQDSLNISFDEAFSGFESPSGLTGESLSGSLAYSAPQAPLPPTPTQSPSTTTNVNPFPAVSPPASPKSVPPPRTSPTRPVSPPPPRQKSPPPRVSKSSRPSTASNKDEKSKDPPPRHSKLSIRLPFGRKKKPQESLPPPPVVPQGSSDLALDDDVESVKQICGMGFTRDQAVAALETHGYDTQKAINSLLG